MIAIVGVQKVYFHSHCMQNSEKGDKTCVDNDGSILFSVAKTSSDTHIYSYYFALILSGSVASSDRKKRLFSNWPACKVAWSETRSETKYYGHALLWASYCTTYLRPCYK